MLVSTKFDLAKTVYVCNLGAGTRLSKLPVIIRPVRQFCFQLILDSSFKRFENCTVKLSAKETKWTSLEVRTHPTFDFKI